MPNIEEMVTDEKIKQAIRDAFQEFGLTAARELVDTIAKRVIEAQR